MAQLKKLRGKSLREISARGRQEIAKLNERLLGFGTAEMSDAALAREVKPPRPNGTGDGASALVLERIRTSLAPDLYEREVPVFLPSLTCRDEIPALVRQHFPGEWRSLIARANRAIEGRFDLLGYTDLRFGEPIDWLLEPVSGKRAPLDHWSKIDYLDPEVAGDKKVTWELNRHAHFVTLGQAYWLTSDERFAEAFVEQANSWMDANPPNLGINWASSLELAFRSISWVWALHLFAESRHLSSKFVARLLKFLVAQGRHIESYLSRYFSPNTHLTGEALGLLYIGAALPELSRARAWRQLGLAILLEQLPTHVGEDGVYFERSSYYHRYTADFYIHLLALARSCYWPLPVEVERRLSLALDHLMWITRPDGTSPLYGDDDGGRLLRLGERAPDDFRDTLATGAALFGRGDWKFVAGDAAVETLWLLGPEGLERYNQIEVRLPADRARAFIEGGYYITRDGWWRDSSYAIVDCGPHGIYNCGHAHSDALSLEFAALGTTWLVDPGTYTYTADREARDRFRETAAHNTATVDGLSQSEPGGAFTWNHVASCAARDFLTDDCFTYFEGSQDGYLRLADPVEHTRAALFLKQESGGALPTYLILRDTFTAQDTHDYAVNFHFPASCSAVASNNQLRASNRNGHKLAITAFGGKQQPRARVAQDWVSRSYGRREAAPVGIFETRGAGAQEILTLMLPAAAKQPVAHVERHHTEVAHAAAVAVALGEARDLIIAGDGVQAVECEQLRAIAAMAWARFVEARLLRAAFVNGREVEVKAGFALRSAEVVKHCVIRATPDQIAVTIEGAESFDIDLLNPAKHWQTVVVNGARFTLTSGQRAVSFVRDAGHWKRAPQNFVAATVSQR